MGAIERFSVGNRDADKLKLDLKPALTLRGFAQTDARVSGTVAEGYFSVKAAGRAETGEGFSQVKFKSGEAFQIGGLLPGEYYVYAAPLAGWVISKVEYGALDAIHQIFTLDAGSPPVKITLSHRFGTVTGRVTDGGRPMFGAAVVLVPQPLPENPYVNSFISSLLDEDGRYEFRFVVPGRYRVIPFYKDTLPFYRDLQALREHAKGYREVVVRAGKACAGIDFEGQQKGSTSKTP